MFIINNTGKNSDSVPKELKNLNGETVQNTRIHIRESYFLFLCKTLKGENSFNIFLWRDICEEISFEEVEKREGFSLG